MKLIEYCLCSLVYSLIISIGMAFVLVGMLEKKWNVLLLNGVLVRNNDGMRISVLLFVGIMVMAFQLQ